MVKRYEWNNPQYIQDEFMVEAGDGNYVTYDDYQKLLSAFNDRVRVIEMQLEDKERLEAENARLRSALEEIVDMCKDFEEVGCFLASIEERAKAALSATGEEDG